MNFIKNFDYLSKKVSLTINNEGETSFKTLVGGIISFLSFFCSLMCGSYFIFRLLKRKDLSIIQSTQINPFINITYSHKLPFLLRLSDTNSLPYQDDEKLYYITSSIWYGGSNNTSLIGNAPQTSQSFNISKCNLDVHFDDEFKSFFNKFENLNSYYCLPIRNYSQNIYGLYGNTFPFSYYSFTLRFCKNTTENNNSCYSNSDIRELIKSPYLDVIFIDYTIDSLNKKEVKKLSVRKERYELSILLYKRIWLYLENIKFITDNGYFFSKNQIENFYRYESVRIDPSLLEGEKSYFSTLTILNSLNTSIYNKQYTKFQDYIAIIGGIVKIVTLLCSFLNYFNSQNSYYLKIIHDFIIEDKFNEKWKNNIVKLNSSMNGKSIKISNNSNNDISKNESCINTVGQIHWVKEDAFRKIDSSISNKIFPIYFANKETKQLFQMYKELINQRLNIINILKKLEVIQIPDNFIKKSMTIQNVITGQSHLKLAHLKFNNYLGENN